MLAVHSKLLDNQCNIEHVKILLENGADYTIIDPDTGDNILHTVALFCLDREVSEYIFRNLDIDLKSKNLAGLTPKAIYIR